MNDLTIIVTASILVVLISRLFLKYWPRNGKIGVNLEKVCCPNCKEVMPKIRKPTNLKQALWGGLTCKNCGTEMDKYGVKINS